jgi:hypothetical protein
MKKEETKGIIFFTWALLLAHSYCIFFRAGHLHYLGIGNMHLLPLGVGNVPRA